MKRRLPRPVARVKRALALLPHAPGVYIFREPAGRIVYIGRSRDLANRARSYWTDLGDRPHLVRMTARVGWVEPVVCASEHEAAFLESDLLERHRTRFNRTLGMESRVWLRLDANPASPGLTVEHELSARDGARWFGPYLGWEPARQAAAALLRLFPVRYAGAAIGRSERELGRSLGVNEGDAAVLVTRIASVLKRERTAVRDAIRGLERMRGRMAGRLMFEEAEALQQQIRAVRWITEPQKLDAIEPVDRDVAAVAASGSAGVRVVLSLRRGSLRQRHVARFVRSHEAANGEDLAERDAEWLEVADANAQLMLKLTSADALGPLGWR